MLGQIGLDFWKNFRGDARGTGGQGTHGAVQIPPTGETRHGRGMGISCFRCCYGALTRGSGAPAALGRGVRESCNFIPIM